MGANAGDGVRGRWLQPILPDPPLGHVGAVHAVDGHGAPALRGHGAEVLPDDQGAGPLRLQAQDGVVLLRPVPDVDALAGLLARRQHEQPVQPHHVVDAHHPAVGHQPADGVDDVAVAPGPDALRVQRRVAPILPLGVQGVGRRPGAGPGQE